MVQTFLEIEGQKYRIKYQKVKIRDGELYQGILFLKTNIGFSYTVREDKTISFDNDFINKDFQKLIIEVIDHREKKNKHR